MVVLGSLLLGCALVALIALIPVFQRPDPPRWTAATLAGELVTIAIVSAAAGGLALIGAGVIAALRQGPGVSWTWPRWPRWSRWASSPVGCAPGAARRRAWSPLAAVAPWRARTRTTSRRPPRAPCAAPPDPAR